MNGLTQMRIFQDKHSAGKQQQDAATSSLDQKYRWIVNREWEVSHRIAVRLVDKPELSVWMILIPIIFLHFMHRASKFKAGLAAVSKELFISREFALLLARESIESGAEQAIDPESRFPTGTDTPIGRQLREAELAVSRHLIAHYRRLLRADGNSYPELLRNAYGSETNYRQQYLQPLLVLEQRIADCARQLAEDPAEAEQTIAIIIRSRQVLRDEEIRHGFASHISVQAIATSE